MKEYDVVVVGSGLSGLSAAVSLADKGKKVLVLESRKVIGGRTSSWEERGMKVESGLHRFLGFYEALPALLEHVGVKVDDIIFWEDEIEIRLPDGQPSAVFGASPLHKPLKSVGALLLNNDFIPPVEKVKISAFFSKGFLDLRNNPEKLDSLTVYEYAREKGLSEETIERELIPMTEGLFFLSVKKYSAYIFFALFAPYLTKLHKTRVGAFLGGMTEVMMNPLADYIYKKGGEIHVNSPVEELMVENGEVRGVITSGKKVPADHVILATSLVPAQRLLQGYFADNKFFTPMLSLNSMPSVTFQLELTEPAMDLDRTTFSPGTIFSSYAEQSRTTFTHVDGRLSVILTHPEKYLKVDEDKIFQDILSDAQRLNLNLDRSKVKNYRKVSWPNDFYSYEKGNIQRIPPQRTPINGLSLAGDYTKQEFLQTMEGAVVSGQLAAESV